MANIISELWWFAFGRKQRLSVGEKIREIVYIAHADRKRSLADVTADEVYSRVVVLLRNCDLNDMKTVIPKIEQAFSEFEEKQSSYLECLAH